MKLVIAIAHDKDRAKLGDALTDAGYHFTRLGSTGGFLRQGNVTLLVGVEDDDAARVVSLVRATCGKAERFVNVPGDAVVSGAAAFGSFPPHPVKVEAGGAVAFVLSVDSFHRM